METRPMKSFWEFILKPPAFRDQANLNLSGLRVLATFLVGFKHCVQYLKTSSNMVFVFSNQSSIVTISYRDFPRFAFRLNLIQWIQPHRASGPNIYFAV